MKSRTLLEDLKEVEGEKRFLSCRWVGSAGEKAGPVDHN